MPRVGQLTGVGLLTGVGKMMRITRVGDVCLCVRVCALLVRHVGVGDGAVRAVSVPLRPHSGTCMEA